MDPEQSKASVGPAPELLPHPADFDDGELGESTNWDGGTTPGVNGRAGRPGVLTAGELMNGVFEIRAVLAATVLGQVYEAHDRLLERLVAVKANYPHVAREALAREARLLASLRCPSLPAVHGFGTYRNIDYLVLERLPGPTLAEKLARRPGGLPIDEALDLLIAIAGGVAALHHADLVHRDLMPGAVVLAGPGRVVLTDFEIARQDHYTTDEATSGSPFYMAPEAATGRIHPGHAHLVDVYALGVVAFELLTGRKPFDGRTAFSVMLQHVQVEAPRPGETRPEVPAALDRLVREMLAKRAADRPAIDLVAAGLRAIRSSLGRVACGPLQALVVGTPAVAARLGAWVREAAPATAVRTAGDERDALALLHERAVDLIVVDASAGDAGMSLCSYLRGAGVAGRATVAAIRPAGAAQPFDPTGVTDALVRGGVDGAAAPLAALVRQIERSCPRSTG